MVSAWHETVTIPTYEVGTPEKNPIFLEKRVYQGSSGVVYPYPVIEKIADAPVDHEWHAVWLENEYVKVMILPELGGRIQMAYDKVKKRHFVYYNHVIKPALVGLAGPWISGGIEFNWPQHHRPSTYMPVDCDIEQHSDGSVTVWVSEMERMFHQKGMAGFTLRPGCAYLEIRGQLYNRTDLPQTFLWWANPAVAVNDQYQSVFPPDINAVFDHGKRAVSSFPIATGTYYKMDYSAGVDISNYRNIKVPTSYMAVNSKYDFEGGYENDTQAGMLHVASHHFSPGKKQWTWGNGDFGRAWDRNLTDADGPYIELMAGVYTENQPDFSWLMPYEEKRFTQYFMPYREVGMVKQATRDFVFGVEDSDAGHCLFKLQATSRQEAHIVVRCNDEVIYEKSLTLSPEEVFADTINAQRSMISFQLFVVRYGHEVPVLQWQAEPDEIRPIPDAAEAALLPAQVKTNEQLFLTGQHIEQYRHATYLATDYYEEALRRDPDDIRCLNAMGLWNIRKGRFSEAEPYLRHAVRLIMKRNPNPYEGEPIYNLALSLKYQGRLSEAYELFWKASWNKAWADAAYFEAARISVAQDRLDDALDELDRALTFGARNQKALALKAAVLRLMGRTDEALAVCDEALKTDRFNYGCLFEQFVLTGDGSYAQRVRSLMHGNAHNYDEIALDYRAAGLEAEAEALWEMAIQEKATTPMTYYYLGRYEEAEKADGSYCFPNSLDAIIALERAKTENESGAKASYYLGCLYYDKRQYDLALDNWQLSSLLDDQFPTVWRNLALVFFNKLDRKEEAAEMMAHAFELNPTDARILMELDQLRKRMGQPHEQRLAFLNQYPDLVAQRDDLLLEKITLLNQTAHYQEAMTLLDAHTFHPWEGGEGKVPAQYQLARTELAKLAIAQGDKASLERAVSLLSECLEYPHHLGEGKLHGAQENDFHFFLGLAYQKLSELSEPSVSVEPSEPFEPSELSQQSVANFELAAMGNLEPAAAMYYNDAKPEKIFYQGLALLSLGRKEEANSRFYKLINYGKQHLFDEVVMDYFAVSLPDLQIWEGDLNLSNRIHCKFMLALGYLGLGDRQKALSYLHEVEQLDVNHLGILALRTLLPMY